MKRMGDAILGALARGAAVTVVLMLAVLVGVLLVRSIPSLRVFGPGFFVSSAWRPNEIERPVKDASGKVVIEDGEVKTETVPPEFGALPVIYGTAVTSVIALLFAVPLSLGTALFIVRVAPRLRVAAPVSFLVEFLASIPSIAYGIWGLFVLAPFLRDYVEPPLSRLFMAVPGLGWLASETIRGAGGQAIAKPLPLTGRDLLCGGLILGIMILPIITAVSRDVLRTVPRGQIEGTLALGATWWQSCVAMLRYSRAGLFGAIMLGLARAAGETMAVAMVIGNNNQLVPSPFAPAQTMSSLLANEFAEAGRGLHTSALLEVALILLVMSLVFNIIARWLVVGKGARTAASA
jgi:phosphate transport system permease protein